MVELHYYSYVVFRDFFVKQPIFVLLVLVNNCILLYRPVIFTTEETSLFLSEL